VVQHKTLVLGKDDVGNTSIIYQGHCHNKANNYNNFIGRTISSFPIASVMNEIEWSYSTEVD
jgi:hypothetical protein